MPSFQIPDKFLSMAAFKDVYSATSAKQMAKAIKSVDSNFDEKCFLKNLDRELSALELKDRMKLLSLRLHQSMGSDLRKNLKSLVGSLADDDSDSKGLSGFLVWPLTEYVATYGRDHFSESMSALKEMTKVFTSEWAVRPFIMDHEKESLKLLLQWSKDESHHVRRLVSEGTRPLLPWGSRLKNFHDNPDLTLPLLENLVLDPSEYVRKSVANHVNDHTKKHPEWSVDLLKKWQKEHPVSKELNWILRHASRTLLKNGHPGALALHGYGDANMAKQLDCKWIQSPQNLVKMGSTIEFCLRITNKAKKNQKVLLDYAIHFRKKNGELKPKVFKASQRTLGPGETWDFKIRHPIKEITTRKYYAGEQMIEPLLNGRAGPTQIFKLKV